KSLELNGDQAILERRYRGALDHEVGKAAFILGRSDGLQAAKSSAVVSASFTRIVSGTPGHRPHSPRVPSGRSFRIRWAGDQTRWFAATAGGPGLQRQRLRCRSSHRSDVRNFLLVPERKIPWFRNRGKQRNQGI